MHAETLKILNVRKAACAGTVEAQEIGAMIRNNHPVLAMMDALLALAHWHRADCEGRIADDGYTGQYWIGAAKNVRYMFSSASPKGFSAGACEAVFWRAMDIAGFTESDL